MFRLFAVKSLFATIAYVLSCCLALSVLVVSFKAHETISALSSIGGSDVIPGNTPSVGEMNILVMGLESREDWYDNPLSASQLGPLHAGSEQGITSGGVGGHTTNTLILIHIFKGGKKAVGISIPRDDLVTFARNVAKPTATTYYPAPNDPVTKGKIDEAYGDAWAQEYDTLAGKGLSHNQEATDANEAGRAAEIATVEYLTGVHVDNFVEVNLIGFYDLAQAMGGIWVCLYHPVPHDKNSGFFARHGGTQHLDAKMALAFVRQREGPTMPNGDLDRTHRQQAFIDSVIHQLKTEGVLGDFGKVNALLGTAGKLLITDKQWNLLSFADDMAAFTGKNLKFYTAPTLGPGVMNRQDINLIDPAEIAAQVQSLFYPTPSTRRSGAAKKVTDPDPGKTTVVVYNGTTVPGLAGNVSAALVKEGYLQGTVGDTQAPQARTEVLYGAGAQVAGEAIAGQFGVTAQASSQVPAGTVKILLGPGVSIAHITRPASQPSSSASNAAGGPVSVSGNKIPCVN